MRKGKLFRNLVLVSMALFAISAVQAYSPYDSVSVTSHYDANGSLTGVEAYGPCGFSLYGSTGAYSTNQVINCSDLDQIELPF